MTYRIYVRGGPYSPSLRVVDMEFGSLIWISMLDGKLHGTLTAWCPALRYGNTSAVMHDQQVYRILSELLGPLDFSKATARAA